MRKYNKTCINNYIDSGERTGWNSVYKKEEPKKSCNTCKYSKYTIDDEPCKSCVNYHTKWEPKDTEDAPKKTCDMCKHYACSLGEEPCRPCKDKSNWEPKDAEK